MCVCMVYDDVMVHIRFPYSIFFFGFIWVRFFRLVPMYVPVFCFCDFGVYVVTCDGRLVLLVFSRK